MEERRRSKEEKHLYNKYIVFMKVLGREEFENFIQALVKENEITDRIKIYYTEKNDCENAISNYIEIIKKETLALDIIKKELDTEEVNLNGVNVKFDVERVSK